MWYAFRTGLRASVVEGKKRGRRNAVLWIGAAAVLLTSPAAGKAETMSGALALAYQNNPDLNQQRAGVRAADENIPRRFRLSGRKSAPPPNMATATSRRR